MPQIHLENLTELTTTNKTLRTNEKVQGNLLHDYERKIAYLPDLLQLIKLCSQIGITKTVAKGQYFTTLDDAELDKLGSSCREYTLRRDNSSSKVKGWIRGNTKIGPALEVAVSYRSWVMIVNGIDEYVTEMTEETRENHIDDIGDSTEEPVAEARLKQTSMSTTSSPTVTLPYHLLEEDRRRTRKVRQKLFRSGQKDDQIASTRSFSTSRRRRSSRIQDLGTDVSFRIYVFSVLVNSDMADFFFFAKRRRS